jgi:oxygen-independent coproporphyrinogen-3 oxidase
VVRDGAAPRRDYLSALEAELEFWGSRIALATPELRFDTIYLGGGTPSALDPEELEQVLEWIRHYLPLAGQPRLSLEANPEDVSFETAARWRDLGVSFLSLGVQSLQAAGLKQLGRRHSVEQARSAIALAVGVGFETVSVDLIYCLPAQSEQAWLRQLEEVVELSPSHLSCYELTFHEGTPFGQALARGSMRSMPEDTRARMFELTHRRLGELGYEGYDVSNFALPGARSTHNQKYWQHAPYLGIGPSAHSFDGRTRWWNRRGLSDWHQALGAAQSPIADGEFLDQEQLRLEALMFALRKIEGTSLLELEGEYGFERPTLVTRALPLVAEGLIEDVLTGSGAGVLQATLAGRAVAESLAVRLSMD